MAPQTRSSAPSTPIAKQRGSDTTPKSARKTPHCSKCHRPRAGHPRSGCPYAASSTDSPSVDAPDLTSALGSMQIQQGLDEHARARQAPPIRQDTLASLSTDSSAIVNMLLQPGIMGDHSIDAEELGKFPIPKWQNGQKTPPKSRGKLYEGRIMPGTLDTPNSSILDTEPSSSKRTKASPPPPINFDTPATAGAPSLARSMSVQERAAFLDGLAEISKAPPATVYTVPVGELPDIQRSAAGLGFQTRILKPKNVKKERHGLLIIGTDSHAVDVLFDRLAEEGSGGLRSAAGGAVVGAVATFTGLAFT